MPIVGIAVGYYYNFSNNFLKPFLDKLSSAETDKDVRLTILVPTFVCDDFSLYKRSLIRRLGLKYDLIQNFRILVDPNEKETLQLYDIPSTILALFKTVNYVFEI